ncbi:MAG TPA: single-stranded DNA-binding protein [Gemmatimonadaceae bacterium]
MSEEELNKVILEVRLGAEPRYFQGQHGSFARLRVLVSNTAVTATGERRTSRDFWTVVAKDHVADYAATLHKGDSLFIIGALGWHKYTNKAGQAAMEPQIEAVWIELRPAAPAQPACERSAPAAPARPPAAPAPRVQQRPAQQYGQRGVYERPAVPQREPVARAPEQRSPSPMDDIPVDDADPFSDMEQVVRDNLSGVTGSA